MALANITQLEPYNLDSTASYTFANVTATSNVVAGNVNISGIVSSTGNVYANVFVGNGSQLTGVVSSSALTANTVTDAAQPNITSVGTLSSVSVSGNTTTGNMLTGGLISATGNVTGAYFIGNGSQLTGLPAGYANSDVANYLASGTDSSNIITTGNVTGGNLLTSGLVSATSNIYGNNIVAGTGTGGNITGANVITATTLSATANVTGGNVTTTGLITASGNITGNYFIGNGSQLTGITATTATTAATVTTNAQPNITSVGTLTSVTVSGNTTTGNLLTGGLISATGNITGNAGLFNGGLSVVGNITATGNLNYQNVTDLVVGDPLIYIGANNTSDLVDLGIVASANVGGIYQHLGFVRDHTDAKWKLFANVVAEPTTVIDWANAVYQTFVAGNVSSTGTVVSTGNVTGGNLLTGGLMSSAGNAIHGNVLTGGLISATSTITSAANITGGNLLTGGLVSSTGNLTAGNILTAGIMSSTGNAIHGNILTGGLISATSTITSAANITGGNVLTGGLISATSTITSAANITGGNVLTGGLISATGNVTGNYFLGNGSQLTGITATTSTSLANGTSNVNIPVANGNITASVGGTSNVVVISNTTVGVTGIISASGNITGGNLTTTGSTGNITGANVISGVTLTASGNVYGSNVVTGTGTGGNITGANVVFANTFVGTQLSGTSNVITVLSGTTFSVVSNTITSGTASVTGNTTVGNLLTAGLISATGNVYAATLGANINFANNTASYASFKGYSLITQALGSVSGSTTANLAAGNYVTATATGAITWTFSNPIASPNASGFILELTNGGAYTMNWPAGTKWPGGSAPTLTTSGTDVLVFITDDGGSTWRGVLSMSNSS